MCVLVAISCPLLAPFYPSELAGRPLEGPCKDHLLGTNDLGQDIFSRLVYGTRATLALGLLGALFSVSLSTALGMISAYYGGWLDEMISRGVDILMTVPGFPLLLVLAIFFSPSIFVIAGLMGLLGGVQGIRIIRSQVLSLAEAEFVQAARVLGASDYYIIIRHILPNILTLATVNFVFAAQRFMLMGVGLGFLGLGDPAVIDWGQMINRAYSNGGFALGMWWWLIPPALAVVLLSMVLAMIGYSLEDELDPRLKRPESVR
ncbi:MAG: ABC transporter permease [Methanotrichaceae archaeon]|nr:ABC transporter permease [Methanotrichaceae archaeon]